VIFIVWDTRGEGSDSDAVFWCGPANGHDGQGWSDDIREAIDYSTCLEGGDLAHADLRTARETVHRGVQRGRVEVQEIV